MSSSTTATSSSVSSFLATLIPVAIQAGAFFLVFLLLRNKMKRVYRPRTFLSSVPEPLRSKGLPEGRFNWLWSFKNLSDDLVLNHQSLDGYLYLRFLKMLTVICFVGCCITWPVLFSVNATGDGGQTQFDLLSFSNIGKDEKNRYYAHVFIGWIFFSKWALHSTRSPPC
jgi:calcium permeable stress-gated cation channel